MLNDDAWNATLTRVSDDRIVIAHAAVRILAVSLRILCFDATVRKPQCGKLVQDFLAQFLASRMRILVIATVVGIPDFRAMRTRCSSGVDMDAHEHRRALFSRTANTLGEARQLILCAGHIHANILIFLELSLACLRDLPIYICFIEAIGRRTRIGSSMTRIERNHDRAIIGLCRNAFFGSSRSHDACRCIKIARSFELPLVVERIDGHIPIGHFFSFGLSAQGHARVLLRLECAVCTLFCKIERIGLLLARCSRCLCHHRKQLIRARAFGLKREQCSRIRTFFYRELVLCASRILIGKHRRANRDRIVVDSDRHLLRGTCDKIGFFEIHEPERLSFSFAARLIGGSLLGNLAAALCVFDLVGIRRMRKCRHERDNEND